MSPPGRAQATGRRSPRSARSRSRSQDRRRRRGPGPRRSQAPGRTARHGPARNRGPRRVTTTGRRSSRYRARRSRRRATIPHSPRARTLEQPGVRLGIDDRAHLASGQAGRTDHERPGGFHDPFDHGVVDTLHADQPARCRAFLSGEAEGGGDDGGDHLVEIRVAVDDDRVLPA